MNIPTPNELIHQIRFKAYQGQEIFFDTTLPAWKLSNNKVTLTYEPETIEDQEIINSYGGLDNTPAYLVRLRPVIKVNGERTIIGEAGLPMGSEYVLDLDIISPNSTEKISNTHIMGNLAMLGIVSQQAIIPQELPQEQQDAEYLLHKEAMSYIKRWNQAEEELGSLFKIAVIRPIPTVMTLGGVIQVDYLLDQPHEFTFKGLYIDADLRAVEFASRISSNNSSFSLDPSSFMRLSSLQGSVLENKVIEDDFGIQCISTAKLFGLINSQPANPQPVNINKTNIAQLLPTLSLPQNIKDAITNAVNQGFTVRVPQTELTYEDWTGTGYIMERASTGEAGYMLSGQIAGGMTAITGARWTGGYWDLVSQPYSGSPNPDPNAAYSIYKISSGDLQLGKAGQTLTSPLQVMVLDRQNRPVQNALVTFKTLAGGGTFSNNESAIQIASRRNGIAEVNFTLGQRTVDNPTYWFEQGYTYSDQVGMNLVDAALMNGTHLKTPFAAYGFPGPPHELKKLHGDEIWENILGFSGFVSVRLEDQYDNPIANKQVVFTAQRAEANAGCFPPNENRDRAMLIQVSDACMQGVPSFAQCSNNGNNIPTSQTIITSPQDAAVQVFLGAIPNAAYKITAQCNGVNPVTFTQHTRDIGACLDPHPPARILNVGTIFQSDSFGHSINAAKSGNSLPLNARAYFLLEGDKITDFKLTCYDNNNNPYTKPCQRLDGTRNFQEVAPTQVSVDFDGQAGQDLGNGIFHVNYKLPDQPGIYPVRIKANGKLKVRKDNAGCQTSCLIDDPYMLEKEAWTYQPVFSVGFVIPEPIVVMVDEKGLATSDTRIDYTILPASYTAGSAFIFLYKDDVLNTYMPTETKGPGFGIISKGYEFDLSKPYEAEVVLNFRTGVEIRSKRIPIRFESLAVKKTDLVNFPDTRLRWDDYYPKLGTKTITILGKDDQGQPFTSGRIQAELIFPYQGHPLFDQVHLTFDETNGAFSQGEAKVRLSAPNIAPPLNNQPDSGLNQIEIRFTYISNQGENKGSIQAVWNVRNNSNVKMKEVLAGEAVFVFDDNAGNNHKGVTPANVIDDNERYFDFVQELINQVVTRKRSVAPSYDLVEENGLFDNTIGNNVQRGILLFKLDFGVDNTTPADCDFRKLMKDYNYQEGTEDYENWKDRFVDKKLLIGDTLRISGQTIDNRINGSGGADTGLYELYVNVVRRFAAAMIALEERYAGIIGAPIPTDLWISRTGEGPVTSEKPHGKGMSYCYGCKDAVEDFNEIVANCRAESGVTIQAREQGVDDNNKYRGNINYYNCNLGQGEYDWAGLYKDEQEKSGVTGFLAIYWAGTDCSGLTQRGVHNGRNVAPGVDIAILIPGDNTWISSQGFFENVNYVYPLNIPTGNSAAATEERNRILKKLKRSDLLRYTGHVATVYSEKPTLVGDQVRYKLIHAYGGNENGEYQFPNIPEAGSNAGQTVFGRKVIITFQNIKTPNGFGRIKLWN